MKTLKINTETSNVLKTNNKILNTENKYWNDWDLGLIR